MSDIDALAKAAERRIAMSGRSALARARAEDRLAKLVAATAASAARAPQTSSSSWPWIASGGAIVLAAAVVTSVFTRSAPPPVTATTVSAPESTPIAAVAAPPVRALAESTPVETAPLPDTTPVVRAEAARPQVTAVARNAPSNAAPRAASPSTEQARPAAPLEKEPAAAIEPAPASEAESAASLFEQANTARRASEYVPAEKLYRRLLDAYPASREAATSRIILGRMILSRGDASAALALFDRYLAESATGSLAEQALVGRAQCLQRLQRVDEERAAWRRLLDAFPGSPNRAEALERLR